MPLAACCALAGCSPADSGLETFSGPTMGTTWSVQLMDLPADLPRDSLTGQISAALDDVNQAMSTYLSDSEIVRFNRHAGTDWFPVSPAVVEVVSEAIAVSHLSGGAFDVTVGPVVDLWGFGAAGTRTERPAADDIAAARARTGYRHLEVRFQPPALRKKLPELSIDLSAIAKGYAVDRIANLLEERGSRHYLVEIGGELRARGHNARDTPWSIGVEQPDPMYRQVERMLPLRDLAIATSGDYRNFFDADGRHYSHTINPGTGEPVDHDLASVSVLADTAMRADAMATALLVLGPKAGAELAKREDIAAMFIVRDHTGFQITMSSALQQYLDDIAETAPSRVAQEQAAQ